MGGMGRVYKRTGRPRLDRVRYPYRVSLETVVLDRLREQSEQAGYPTGTYMARVLGLAHGFDSPFLPPPAAPLPTAVPAEDLQRHVRELTPEACEPPLATNQKSFIRLDEGLGQKVDAWCNEHGVDYAGYLRSILRLAAGFDSIDQLQPTHVQPQLDLDASQERPKAS